jgi:hypothetical protein
MTAARDLAATVREAHYTEIRALLDYPAKARDRASYLRAVDALDWFAEQVRALEKQAADAQRNAENWMHRGLESAEALGKAEAKLVRAEEALRHISNLSDWANLKLAVEIAREALAAAGADTP